MKPGTKAGAGNEFTLNRGEIERTLLAQPRTGGRRSGTSGSGVVFPRLLIGLIILTCTEVFSGASFKVGLWHPWTWLVTYWLYFVHFFFFTTLAIRTGRTSLWSLYLWGVLFGLYESWITKVIWFGYGGDGKFVMGSIGPYGFSEISMVFLFHPVAAFLLPLAVTCLLWPPLRRLFPDLAWFTGPRRAARLMRAYLVFSIAPVMAMNSGGPARLAVNLAVLFGLLLVFSRLARPDRSWSDGRSIVVFRGWGFVGLCVYLVLLYGVTYVFLRPEGLPSASVQLLTFVFYALAIAGLYLHRRREPLPDTAVEVEAREFKQVKMLFALVIALAFVLSIVAGAPILFVPIAVNFAIWTPLGLLLTAIALRQGLRERIGLTPE